MVKTFIGQVKKSMLRLEMDEEIKAGSIEVPTFKEEFVEWMKQYPPRAEITPGKMWRAFCRTTNKKLTNNK